MTIALPILHQRISPLLDTAARLLLVKHHHRRELARQEILLDPQSSEALAQQVAEWDVTVLICAAVSETLFRELTRRHVRVLPHHCGETETILRAFYHNQLHRREFRMPGCLGSRCGGHCCCAHSHRARQLINTDFNSIKAPSIL